MANHNNDDFPKFVLEKEFQCRNKALIKDVVCKTIQNFVKEPKDVRLAITVSFQLRVSINDVSHEHEAMAVIQVDKPGNFYPGGDEQRLRDRELKVFKELEESKRNERRERRQQRFGREERKQTRKNDLGVKRPPNGTTGGIVRGVPPPPFKAELRQLPTGEMYAVREVVGEQVALEAWSIFEEMRKLDVLRMPCSEEMLAIREHGKEQDDATDRDGSSIESVRTCECAYSPPESRKSTRFVDLPSKNQIRTTAERRLRGSVKLEDDGNSSRVLTYIAVD